MSTERWNRLHPGEQGRIPRVTELLGEGSGPVVAVTDHMTLVPDQIGRWVPRTFVPLGTDGFGRSDTREAMRRFFEIDTGHIVVATLWGLAHDGVIEAELVDDAIRRYDIDPDATDPKVTWPED